MAIYGLGFRIWDWGLRFRVEVIPAAEKPTLWGFFLMVSIYKFVNR